MLQLLGMPLLAQGCHGPLVPKQLRPRLLLQGRLRSTKLASSEEGIKKKKIRGVRAKTQQNTRTKTMENTRVTMLAKTRGKMWPKTREKMQAKTRQTSLSKAKPMDKQRAKSYSRAKIVQRGSFSSCFGSQYGVGNGGYLDLHLRVDNLLASSTKKLLPQRPCLSSLGTH